MTAGSEAGSGDRRGSSRTTNFAEIATHQRMLGASTATIWILAKELALSSQNPAGRDFDGQYSSLFY